MLLGLAAPAFAQQVQIGHGSVVQTVTTLKAGQFVWAPQVAPDGPMQLIVNFSDPAGIALSQRRSDRRDHGFNRQDGS